MQSTTSLNSATPLSLPEISPKSKIQKPDSFSNLMAKQLEVPVSQQKLKLKHADTMQNSSHILKIVPSPKRYGFKRYQTLNLSSICKTPIEKKNTQLSIVSPTADSLQTSSMQSLSLNFSQGGTKQSLHAQP